jgi:hypothetical protein
MAAASSDASQAELSSAWSNLRLPRRQRLEQEFVEPDFGGLDHARTLAYGAVLNSLAARLAK